MDRRLVAKRRQAVLDARRHHLICTARHQSVRLERHAGTTSGGSGAAHEMLADRLGSVLEVVGTATNTVTGSATFDAFGQRTVTGAAERYGFTGREHDAESGLIYFRARHYDPALGQFLQRDPIGFAAGDLNLYAYTWNDPFNWTDPSGLAGTECLAGPACQPQGAGAVGAVGVGALSLADKIRALLTLANVVNAMDGGGEATDHDESNDLTEEEKEKLKEAGKEMDPADKSGERTKAGRAAEKHGIREDDPFPKNEENVEQKK